MTTRPSSTHQWHLGVASLNVTVLASHRVAELVQEHVQLKDDHLPVALVQAVRLGHPLDDVGELLSCCGTHLVTPGHWHLPGSLRLRSPQILHWATGCGGAG